MVGGRDNSDRRELAKNQSRTFRMPDLHPRLRSCNEHVLEGYLHIRFVRGAPDRRTNHQQWIRFLERLQLLGHIFLRCRVLPFSFEAKAAYVSPHHPGSEASAPLRLSFESISL